MRILGIDPGLNLIGYGCVDLTEDPIRPALVEAGVLRLQRGESLSFRLQQLHDDLATVIDDLQPRLLVVENLFSHYQHATTAIRILEDGTWAVPAGEPPLMLGARTLQATDPKTGTGANTAHEGL